ncbi:MAG: hypothetical protein WHT45_12700 [Ignavibacterium sp.]
MINHNKSGFENDLVPKEFYLSQNYPNPFRDKTVIKYCVAQKRRIKITVFDTEGNEILRLVDEEKNPGTYEVIFKSTIGSRRLAIGNYYYRIEATPIGGQAEDYINEKKMELIK